MRRLLEMIKRLLGLDRGRPVSPPNFSSSKPLNSTETNLEEWPPFDHRNYGNDGAVLLVGTLAQLARHFLDAVFVRRLANTGLHQIRGAAAGGDDIQYVQASEREAYTSSSRDGEPTRRTWHPDSPIIAGHHLGRGYVEGLESDPEFGAQLLAERPLLKKDLDAVAAKFVDAAHTHRLTACKLISASAFGGHMSWHQYLVDKISRDLELTVHFALKVLPSPDELISVENARAELYRMLTAGLDGKEIPILYQNRHRGGQDTDDALVQGLITLAANSKDGSDLDGSSLKRIIKQYGSGWVEAHPTFVYTPCGRGTEESRRSDRYTAHAINLPDTYGGRTVDMLLHRISELITRAPDALHAITVAAWLPGDEEIRELKEAAVLLKPGHVIPMINRIESPIIHNFMARATLCDFVISEELPPALVNMFEGESRVYGRAGVAPAQFLEQTRPPASYKKAERVAELVTQIAQS